MYFYIDRDSWVVIQTRFYPPSVRLDSKQFRNRLYRAFYVISACSGGFG